MAELKENLAQAIGLYLSTPDTRVSVHLEDSPESVTEHQVLVTC